MELPDGRVRKKRYSINAPGHAHELTFSCHGRLKLLTGDRSRAWLLESWDRAREEHSLSIWAYVIMPQHVHVLIRPRDTEYSMATILKAMKRPFASRATRWLRVNMPDVAERLRVARPSGRVEYRFWEQGGGYDRNMWTAEVILKSIEYIHMNPVRARLVERPTEWAWSSARQYAGDHAHGLRIDRDLPRLRTETC